MIIVSFAKKTNFDDNSKNLNKKVTSNKTKQLVRDDQMKKLNFLIQQVKDFL